jgi:hypothetical protein
LLPRRSTAYPRSRDHTGLDRESGLPGVVVKSDAHRPCGFAGGNYEKSLSGNGIKCPAGHGCANEPARIDGVNACTKDVV